MSVSSAFLDRLRAADKEGDPVGALHDDPSGLGAAYESSPDALEQAFADAAEGDYGAPMILQDDGFASAACNRAGVVIVAGPRFEDWFAGIDVFRAGLRGVAPERPNLSLLMHDRTGRPVAVAAGLVSVARSWPLDAAVRAALESGEAKYAIVAFQPGVFSWNRVAAAFSFTRAEGLLVAALARHGDLQRAARERDIAYETARKFVASAMRKTGAKRQTELIGKTLTVAAGEVAPTRHFAPLLRDLFSLTQAQADLAVMIARGATRDDAGALVGLTPNQVKIALKSIFQLCGVKSAVDLARILSEINALKGLATACQVTLSSYGSPSEPLRLIPRTWNQGYIAVADHGPPGGRPVLVFHSGSGGRAQIGRFVRALQAGGYRPIAIERAGFGLSDFVVGDPWETAVKDVVECLDALGIAQAPVIALSTPASMVACAAAATGRIRGGVLVAPDPPDVPDPNIGHLLLNYFKIMLSRHPDMAVRLLRMIYRRATPQSTERAYRDTAKGCAADRALLDNPEVMADFVRASRQAAIGERGVINEMRGLKHGPQPAPVADPTRWTLMFGASDQVVDTPRAAAFWSGKLPGVTVEILPDAGHWLHASHTADVVRVLNQLSD